MALMRIQIVRLRHHLLSYTRPKHCLYALYDWEHLGSERKKIKLIAGHYDKKSPSQTHLLAKETSLTVNL